MIHPYGSSFLQVLGERSSSPHPTMHESTLSLYLMGLSFMSIIILLFIKVSSMSLPTSQIWVMAQALLQEAGKEHMMQ